MCTSGMLEVGIQKNPSFLAAPFPASPNGSFERPLEPKGGQLELKIPDVILRRGFLSPHNVCISGSGYRRLNPLPRACCKSSSPICSLLQLIVSPTASEAHKGATSARLSVTMRAAKWQSTIPYVDLRNCEPELQCCWPG